MSREEVNGGLHVEKMKKTHRIQIAKRNFYIFLLVMIANIILLEPAYFSTIAVVEKIFNISKILVSLVIIYAYIKTEHNSNFYILFPIIYELCVLFSTCINSANYKSAVLEISYVVSLCLLTQVMINKNVNLYIRATYYVLEIYSYINLFSYIIHPNGLYINGNGFPCYFLGYRNTAYQYMFPMIAFSTINSIMQYRKLKLRVFIDILCYMIFSIKTNTMTGCILGIIYLVGLCLNKLFIYIKVRWVFLTGFFLSFLVVIVKVQNLFAHLITTRLKRNITFTGRTVLWDRLLHFIAEKPIFGWGIVDMPQLTKIYWATHSHNQFLQIVFQCGIAGLILFIFMLMVYASRFDNSKSTGYKEIFVILMIVYMISFLTEGSVKPIFYSLLLLMAENNKLGKPLSCN